ESNRNINRIVGLIQKNVNKLMTTIAIAVFQSIGPNGARSETSTEDRNTGSLVTDLSSAVVTRELLMVSASRLLPLASWIRIWLLPPRSHSHLVTSETSPRGRVRVSLPYGISSERLESSLGRV